MPFGTSLNFSDKPYKACDHLLMLCNSHISTPPRLIKRRHFSKFNWDASCDISLERPGIADRCNATLVLSLNFAPKESLFYILPTSHMWYNVTKPCDHFFTLCTSCVRPSILSSSTGDPAWDYWFTRFCSACIAHLLEAVRQRNLGSKFRILRLNINSIKGVDH